MDFDDKCKKLTVLIKNKKKNSDAPGGTESVNKEKSKIEGLKDQLKRFEEEKKDEELTYKRKMEKYE